MKPIVTYYFKRLRDDELSTKAAHIVTNMTGNESFPQAAPLIEAVIAANTEFIAALAAAQNGGKLQTSIKNDKRTALEKAIKMLGLHVQMNCRDDVSILLSSGFDAQKDREPSELPRVPANFRVAPGSATGSLVLSVDPDKNALVYVFQWTATPLNGQTVWETILGKRTVTIKNLMPGKEYAFRVAIKGPSEELVFSEVITHFAA